MAHGVHMFTQTLKPRLRDRVLRSSLVDLLTGPHGVDRYTELVEPTWTIVSEDSSFMILASALETGEPLTGPSTWILKAPPGCVVPWHSHTAEEQLIVVRGAVMAEMTDHPPTRLGPGGFAIMGSHMAHQFACQGTACVMFASFDRAYDIKWGKAV